MRPPAALARDTALLLDVDGTLLDLAPTPMSVVVPAGLPATLGRLRSRLGDALGFITGRPIAQVDALFGALPYAVAGEHGGVIRHQPGGPLLRAALPTPPESWRQAAEAIASLYPGAAVEEKARGFVVHYRAAPEAGPALGTAIEALIAPLAGRFQLMAASMAWEVRPRGADKGSAVRELMALPPFLGRRPLFVGDDVTDEDAIAAVRSVGGAGLRVPESFGDAAGVRAWLADLAAATEA